MSTYTARLTTLLRPGSKEQPSARRMSLPKILLLIAGGLLLLSVIRMLTDTGSLTDTQQWASAVGLAVPIGLAGLGGLWAERAGVINIGLEGMMMLGLFAAGWIGWQYGPWAGVLAGILGGVLGGLLHAIATVTFGVDHIVSGVAINILALGVVQFLAKLWFGEGTPAAEAGGNDKQSPQMDPMGDFTVPYLADWLATIRDWNIFFISDTAGILGAAVTGVSWLVLLAVLLFVGTYVLLWRTPFGLRLRSCGESPSATESLGVNVYAYKYVALLVSGGLAGLGGAYLAVFIRMYQDGQTGGRGYLGLATMIFGNWRPGGVAMGAGLFGFVDGLQTRGGGPVVHALLLLFAIALAGYAVFLFYRSRHVLGMAAGAAAAGVFLWSAGTGTLPDALRIAMLVITVVLAGFAVYQFVRGSRAVAAASTCGALATALFLWFSSTETMPDEIVTASPYITTLVILTLFAQRLRAPRAVGKPYRRGEGV